MGWIVLLWIGFLIIGALLAWGASHFLTGYKPKRALGYTFIGLIVVALVASVFLTNQLTNTESFKRWKKSLDSEFKGGITRQITVYSEGGEVIFNNLGKFDVEHSEGRLKWIDENGRVQIIYLGNSATAVVNEIEVE
ncbi:MAG: hypothetical protein ACQEXX_19840 [Bacillota bacterium]